MDMDSIKINDPRATALREWLNERHKAYLVRPVTDAQIGIWLDEAAEHEGLVEIRGIDSESGAPETYRVAL